MTGEIPNCSTPNPLRCEFCRNIPCKIRSIVDCKIGAGTMNDITSQTGCVINPQAREYLMQPVIADLERRAVTLPDLEPSCTTSENYISIKAAITLIKEGVGKK